MKYIVMIVLVLAFFAAAVLNLALESRFRNKLTGAAIAVAVAVGVIWYGSGYAWASGLNSTSVVRALLALCRMFGGINDLPAIQGSPLVSTQAGLTVFWIGHFCAFYVTASAAITTLGERLVRHIRVKLLRRGPLLVIYGINAGSVAYGKNMIKNKHRSVLFVDPDGNTSFESTIRSLGAVIDKSSDALNPGSRFLRQINIRPGKRKIELAALHTDHKKNYQYAFAMKDAFEAAGILPGQTSLIISGPDEEAAELQTDGCKGYGSVLSFNDYELTARLIIRDNPPCDMIDFDENGKAVRDFRVVLLGYGRMGRAMLAALIRNAQFYGSTFRADIFDPDAQNGFLHEHEVMKHYDISFHAANARSPEFFSFLQKEYPQLGCIVICTGSRDVNSEIFSDLYNWFRLGRKQPVIIQTSRGSYSCMDRDKNVTGCDNIYESDALDVEVIDAMAMQMNHMYCAGSTKSAAEDWEDCSYFSRKSSRASADFYPAMLRAAGRTKEQVLEGDWPPEGEMLENLAVTEHMRWCAFHFVAGFSKMPDEVYEKRAAMYLEEKKETGKSRIPIGKDMENHLHACLIPWEELDALSAKENSITGVSVDYKQMDRNNVIAVADVIKAAEQ